jgi:hypothetical protein
MSGHLQVLMSIFPGKIFLDVDDIAKCLGQSKGHIYNLSSAKKLPFQLEWGLGDKVQVSIVEMAKYLDEKIQVQPAKIEKPALVNPEIVSPKKVGRPRGTTKTRIQLAFQAQLSLAIVKEEVRTIFESFQENLEDIEFSGDETVPCVDKFEDLKGTAGLLAKSAKSALNVALLEIGLPYKPPFKKIKTF